MTERTDPFSRSVVLQRAAADAVTVRSNLAWGDEPDQFLDLYRPPHTEGRRLPVTVLVTGFPDTGFARMFGRPMKDTAPYRSWARLLASRGLAAVTYTNRDPVGDATGVLEHLARHADALGVDPGRCGIWACSGNVPNALAVLAAPLSLPVRCAALCYGYMIGGDGSTPVGDAARQFRFATPTVALNRIAPETAMLIVRAGRDEMPGLNDSIDHFLSQAASQKLSVQLLHHPTGPHAFDLVDDSKASREVVSGILDFLGRQLSAEPNASS